MMNNKTNQTSSSLLTQRVDFTTLAGFQEKQLDAWFTLMDPRCKYLLYGGALGGGKSRFLRWACIGLGMYYFAKYGIRNIPIGLFSEDYPTLKDRQIVKIKNEIPPFLGELVETKNEGHVFRGSKQYGEFLILLRNLDDPSKYQSTEFAAIAVEELTRNQENTIVELRSRLRYPGIEDVKFLGATNPGGPSHAYVKNKWVKPDPTNLDVEQDRFFFVPAKFSDNKYLPKDYVNQLMSLPENKRKAYMDGSWDIFAGQYFSSWRDNLHVINPFIPYKESVIVGGLDWGRVDNFSFHLTEITKVEYEGTSFYRSKVFLEVYGKERTVDEWAREIKKQLKFYNLTLSDVSWIRADTQIFAKSLDGKAIDIYTQFVNCDERFRKLKPANKDRIGGWENLQRWLSIAPDGLPYLQITSNCAGAIRVIPSLIHDENKVEDIDQHGENDAADSIRYLHMSLKWIDGKLGSAKEGQTDKNKQKQYFANMDDEGKMISIDFSKFRR